MNQLLPFLLFLLGFVLIIKGSDWFIDSSIWIARICKIPDIIIGATLVSICTTLPEAMVSTNSAIKGYTDMALGNALGSIACNTGFILGIIIIFSTPILKNIKKIQKSGITLLILLIFIFSISIVFSNISRISGILLLTILIWYIYDNIHDSKQSNVKNNTTTSVACSKKIIFKNISLFIIGVAGTIIGANLLVTNGEIIARILKVPEIIIGLTMTAIGTSLPELATAISSIKKNAHNISIGNILGADILNIILVIGLSSTITPIPIKNSLVSFHLPFILLIVGCTVAFTFINKKQFKKYNGIILLLLYFAYIAAMFIGNNI